MRLGQEATTRKRLGTMRVFTRRSKESLRSGLYRDLDQETMSLKPREPCLPVSALEPSHDLRPSKATSQRQAREITPRSLVLGLASQPLLEVNGRRLRWRDLDLVNMSKMHPKI